MKRRARLKVVDIRMLLRLIFNTAFFVISWKFGMGQWLQNERVVDKKIIHWESLVKFWSNIDKYTGNDT